MLKFENTFANLPSNFYSKVKPSIFPNPKLIVFNDSLSNLLKIDKNWIKSEAGINCFSGKNIIKSSIPLSMVYAGHQFGTWVPQLGDGRAILLGEIIDRNNMRWDVQLKGAGKTPFSRNGDGKATLGPVLREYLISEAMNALKIPTTRSLTAISTGEIIQREKELPGAIITRVAKSHIRVGTFQYFASRGEVNSIKTLADYVIERHYPEFQKKNNKYIQFLRKVIKSQAKLISQWLSVSFIHGVMNTDNTSIIGDTIDYGPCAFMDIYNPNQTFSSIDTFKRYSYSNQALICHWNLTQLASSLLPIISDNEKTSLKLAQNEIDKYTDLFNDYWIRIMRQKIGLKKSNNDDIKLVKELLIIMQKQKLDFTLTFSSLVFVLIDKKLIKRNDNLFQYFKKIYSNELRNWTKKWKNRLLLEDKTNDQIVKLMNKTNPVVIPRNHLVEEALNEVIDYKRYDKFFKILKILKSPFDQSQNEKRFLFPPRPEEEIHQTFCGT